MPRIRTIKPEFWDSPGTARASFRARLFYIALWNWADDYGVGTANPKALIGFAFPNDDDITVADFPTLRKEVADAYGVIFYEVDGRPFYAIPSFDKHQRTERKARRINPPPPPGITAVESSDDAQGTSDTDEGSSGIGTGEQGNRGTGELLLAPAPPPQERDEIWDTMLEACGVSEQITKSARGAYNAARRDLAQVGATPAEIRLRASRFRRRWPNASLTPTALVRRWAELDVAAVPEPAARRPFWEN